MSLPPLPETPAGWFNSPHGVFRANPVYRISGPQTLSWEIPAFTADQLRAYAAQAVLEEREACARVADCWSDGEDSKPAEIAAAIRARSQE
jgi:hypothetical protein